MKSVKSGGFHPWNLWNPWNLADFTQISPVKSTQNYKSKCFSKSSSVWWMQGRGYDQGFDLWNPAEFTLKSGRFDLWNPVDFTQISPVKSTQNYKSKCFSKTSSVWCMQGGGYDQGFDLWNPAEFTQISSMKSTQNYKSKCFSKNSSVWWMQGGGYDQGFHEICWISHEIHMKSTRFHEIHWQISCDFMWNQKTSCKEL